MSESNLIHLPNIGKVLEKKLIQAEINSQEALFVLGSENTFIRLKTIDNGACLQELYALEGAIQGIRWHHLTDTRKKELSLFFKTCKTTTYF